MFKVTPIKTRIFERNSKKNSHSKSRLWILFKLRENCTHIYLKYIKLYVRHKFSNGNFVAKNYSKSLVFFLFFWKMGICSDRRDMWLVLWIENILSIIREEEIYSSLIWLLELIWFMGEGIIKWRVIHEVVDLRGLFHRFIWAWREWRC